MTELQNIATRTPSSSEKRTWSAVALPLTIVVIRMLSQANTAIPQAVAITTFLHFDSSTGWDKLFLKKKPKTSS